MDFKHYFNKNKIELSDKEKIAIALGGLITLARLHAKLSQKQLAELIGTKQPSIARAEAGEVAPSVEFLYKIAKAIKTEFIFPSFGFMGDKAATQFVIADRLPRKKTDRDRCVPSHFFRKAKQ